MKRVAEQLDIGVESLRSWVKRHEIDHGERPGTTTADAQGTRFTFERDVVGDYTIGVCQTACTGLSLSLAVAASAAVPAHSPR